MTGLGLLMLYSASYIFATERFADGYVFIRKQIIFFIFGVVALIIGLKIDYRKWLKLRFPMFFISLTLLILVLLPGLGVKLGGSQRWVRLGILNFQPAELIKYTIVLLVAGQLYLRKERLNHFAPAVLSHFFWIIPAFVLLLLQPDFGTTVMISAVVFIMMFISGVSLKYLGAIASLALVSGAGLVLSSAYRTERFLAFLNPWEDPFGRGFQIIQSLVGFHHGQFWGVGLGNGKEKLFFLPEAHSDFIFAVIGEELGFIGVFVVLTCFVLLIFRGLTIAKKAYMYERDLFGCLLAVGITAVLGLQGLVNMAMVLGLLPTKGLALPFISYGGSGLLINLFAVGVLLSISKTTGRYSGDSIAA